jgi:hypothetical protein
MDYSPFNPVIWLIFAGFVAITYLTVKVFHGKYPNYPQSAEKDEGQEQIVDEKVQTGSSKPVENSN